MRNVMGPKKVEEPPPKEQPKTEEHHGPQLPLSVVATTPGTLLLLLQSKEEDLSMTVRQHVEPFQQTTGAFPQANQSRSCGSR